MAMDRIKGAGATIGGFVMLGVIIAIPVMILMGLGEISVWALDWIPDTIGWATVACVAFIPLAIIPATRGLAANLFGLASFVYLACMWFYAMAFTYIEWGLVALIIGVMFFGVGVVLTAIIAAIFTATWGVLGNIAILFGLGIATRLVAFWLAHLAEKRLMRKAMEERPSGVTLIQND